MSRIRHFSFKRTLLIIGVMLTGAFCMNQVQAQTKIKDGTVSSSSAMPAGSAILELESTQMGLLPPRMSTVQRDAIANPATGLIIYNTDQQCLNQYNGAGWTSQCGTSIVNNTTIHNITNPGSGQLVYNTDNQNYQYYDSVTHTWQSIAVPAMNTAQRDAIDAPNTGQTIFNTDEQCLDTYNGAEWISLCGGIPNAKATIDCSTATYNGMLIQGTAVNSGDYLTVPVTVTKAGMYTITATPNPVNGYYFTTSGSFPAEGTYLVNLPGNGMPANANTAGDPIAISFNGADVNCNGLSVPVQAPAPDYVITNVAVNPAQYPVGVPLTASSDYLAVTLSVKVPGQWALMSNTVNGYSFGAQGQISHASGYNSNGTFPQTVTVTVPVAAGGQVQQYGTGSDQFTLTNSGSETASSYPFSVPLAAVGFTVNCSNVTFGGSPLVQNTALTNQTITLPINVTATATGVTITGNIGGAQFRSGTSASALGAIDLTQLGNQNITLYAVTTSSPTTNGKQNLSLTTTVNGSTSPVAMGCSVSQNITPQVAVISDVSNITPSNSGNYIIDANGNTPATISMSVTTSTPGTLNITTNTVNGVTYAYNGTVTVPGTSTITLSPTGTPTAVTGTQTFTISSNSSSIGTSNINFVYRAMKIAIVSSSNNYNLNQIKSFINTASTQGTANFGVNGTVPTAGITLTSLGNGTGSLSSAVSQGYDIILTCYNANSWNATDVTAVVNYVQNKKGVVFMATEAYNNGTSGSSSGTTIESVVAQLFGVSSIAYNPGGTATGFWYTNNTNQGIYQMANTNDPILNGPFGNIAGGYLGDDVSNTSDMFMGTQPANLVPLAGPVSSATYTNSGLTANQSNSWFAFRHSTLGFAWAGDGGFIGAYQANNNTSNNSPIGTTNPLQPKNWNGRGSNSLSGTQQVANGQFLFNLLAWAIQFNGANN